MAKGECVVELKVIVKTLASDGASLTTVRPAVALGDFRVYMENPSILLPTPATHSHTHPESLPSKITSFSILNLDLSSQLVPTPL